MTARRLAFAVLMICCAALLAGAAEARALRWARSGDVLSLDPHGQDETPSNGLLQNIYETLTERDHSGRLKPLLAASWRIRSDDPSIWEFRLRPGVRFHDGTPLTADDVVFSYERAMQPGSGFRETLSLVQSVAKVDDATVAIRTKMPTALLVNSTPTVFIMSKAWAQAHGATMARNFAEGGEPVLTDQANGTGAFVLVSRQPGVKTVMRRNETYWNRSGVPLEITELSFIPIAQDGVRVAALLAGEVDFIQDVPVQQIQRIRDQPRLRVTSGVENRTIFLGLDIASAQLHGGDAGDGNPFADKRVRQALNLAIDRQAIRRGPMQEQAAPAGIIASPFVNGWSRELDTLPPFDPVKARALMVEAGFASGFSVTLNCPNNRYVNEEGICRAIVAMLGKVGVRVKLVLQSKAMHFPLIQNQPPGTSFFLLGFGAQSYDSQFIFAHLYHSRIGGRGSWNATGYANAEIDRQIVSLARELDPARRDATIAALWARLKDEVVYLPLHNQSISYAMTARLDIPVDLADAPKMKLVAFRAF